MSKTSDFTQSEKGIPQMQTLTNRDFINRIYILRYEDCLEVLVDRFDSNNAYNFINAVERLYWSFIVPRISKSSAGDRAMFAAIRQKAMNQETFRKGETYKELLDLIARKMWALGINRPEKEQADIDHVAVDELEVVE